MTMLNTLNMFEHIQFIILNKIKNLKLSWEWQNEQTIQVQAIVLLSSHYHTPAKISPDVLKEGVPWESISWARATASLLHSNWCGLKHSLMHTLGMCVLITLYWHEYDFHITSICPPGFGGNIYFRADDLKHQSWNYAPWVSINKNKSLSNRRIERGWGQHVLLPSVVHLSWSLTSTCRSTCFPREDALGYLVRFHRQLNGQEG